MKKLFVLLLAVTLLATSCGKDKNNTDDTSDSKDNTMGMATDDSNMGGTDGMMGDMMDGMDNVMGDMMGDDTTLGDTDGDGYVEGEEGDGYLKEDEPMYEPVKSIMSGKDAVNFIGANVYSLCRDKIPAMMTTRAMTSGEMEGLTFDDTVTMKDSIDDIIISESAIEGDGFTLIMLRSDGTDTEKLHTELRDSVRAYEWKNTADVRVSTMKLDDDIVIAVGTDEQVNAVMDALKSASNGIYDNIGDPTHLTLGAR